MRVLIASTCDNKDAAPAAMLDASRVVRDDSQASIALPTEGLALMSILGLPTDSAADPAGRR